MDAALGTHSQTGGYTCWSCKAWVSNGRIHQCVGIPAQMQVSTPYVPDTQSRIAAALERIAAAMEAGD